MKQERTKWAVEIPRLGSLILTHSWNGEVKGLKAWPAADRPYAPVVFWAFRLMVGLGLLMAAVGIAGLVMRARGRLYSARWLHWATLLMAPSGFLAVLAGWTVTEVGRQPYTVYGLMRTADSVSPIALPGVATSLVGFVVVYCIVFGAGLLFILRLMAQPPGPESQGPDPDLPIRSAGFVPLSTPGNPAAGE